MSLKVAERCISGELVNQTREESETKLEVLKREWKALLEQNAKGTSEIIPNRRVCAFAGHESESAKRDVEETIFVKDEEIVRIHPMKFLSHSPFFQKPEKGKIGYFKHSKKEENWKASIAFFKKRVEAIARTQCGKHVILQQSAGSCAPSCVAMLVLDKGKSPNYEAIRFTSGTWTEHLVKWVNQAGFGCEISGIPLENKIEFLSKKVSELGSGILSISHPEMGTHAIILDEISAEKNEAVIRDPFHGWMVTMKLDVLTPWIRAGNRFCQIN